MQQNNRNLLIFSVLALLIFIAWVPLQSWLWPRKPRPLTAPDPRLWSGVPAQTQVAVEQAPGLPGLGNAWNLAAQIAIADYAANGRRPAVAKAEPEPPPKPKKEKEPVRPVAIAPAAPHREIHIGDISPDSTFNYKVVLTSQGAGVLNLILNKFPEANRLGRPAGDLPPPLDLIPKDPRNPSNLLYHYAPPVAGNPEHPLDALGKMEWTVKSVINGPNDPVHEVVFTALIPELAVTVTKTYTLERNTYHLGLALQFERHKDSADALSFRYQLVGAHGLPIEGEWYTTVYRNALIGLVDTNRNDVYRDLQDSRSIAHQAGGNEVARKDNKYIQYAAVATQYFTSAIVVDNEQEAGVKPQDLAAWVRPTDEHIENPEKRYLDDITVRLVSEPFDLKPGVPVVHKYLLYNGPVKVRLLGHLDGAKAVPVELVERYENTLHLKTLTDFGRFSFWSDLLIACTNLMLGLLYYLHRYVMPWSYGLCIILLTVLVRASMFPLSRRQALAAAKMQEKMQELAPEIKKLEAKHKGDAMALNQAKQELYLKKGINPLAMMGSCWMLFLQMPIFLGLYYCLQESINFRLAPFLWMKNLAAPDMLIWWSEKIPFISRPQDQGSMLYLGPYFNLLPIIAAGLMIVSQIMMTPPATDEQQAMQQKMMKFMSALMGLFFYKVASGLCLYFIVSSLWGITERKLLPKRQGAGGSVPPKGDRGTGTTARKKPKSPPGNGNGKLQKVRDMWAEVLKQAKKK
jgi:YidC/Oxa1 family membrane protein insertase